MTSLYASARASAAGWRDVEPEQVARAGEKPRIIDVREPHELTGELGHIRGAELVPLPTVEGAAKLWPRDDELVVVCRSGARSALAAAALGAMGFRRVMNMVGGMLAWNDARLPIERGEA